MFTVESKIKQVNTKVELFRNPCYVIENGEQIKLNIEEQMNEFMKASCIL